MAAVLSTNDPQLSEDPAQQNGRLTVHTGLSVGLDLDRGLPELWEEATPNQSAVIQVSSEDPVQFELPKTPRAHAQASLSLVCACLRILRMKHMHMRISLGGS